MHILPNSLASVLYLLPKVTRPYFTVHCMFPIAVSKQSVCFARGTIHSSNSLFLCSIFENCRSDLWALLCVPILLTALTCLKFLTFILGSCRCYWQTVYFWIIAIAVLCVCACSCCRDSAVKSSAAAVYTAAVGICSTKVLVVQFHQIQILFPVHSLAVCGLSLTVEFLTECSVITFNCLMFTCCASVISHFITMLLNCYYSSQSYIMLYVCLSVNKMSQISVKVCVAVDFGLRYSCLIFSWSIKFSWSQV